MTDTKTIIANLDYLKEKLDNDKIADPALKARLKDMFEHINPKTSSEKQLVNIMGFPEVYAGLSAIDKTQANKTYAELGISLPKGVAPASDADGVINDLKGGDFQGAYNKLKEGNFSPLLFATAAAGASKLFGKGDIKEMAQWGLGAAVAAFGLNYFTGPSGQALLGKAGGALGSAADGTGNFLSDIGTNIGKSFDNPALQSLFAAIKENPLTAIALISGVGYGFSNGKGVFGSMFEAGKWGLVVLAVSMIAQHFLGQGAGKQNDITISGSQADYASASVPAAALPVLPSGTVPAVKAP